MEDKEDNKSRLEGVIIKYLLIYNHLDLILHF